ncbi:hypothetical protein PG993_008623 [Apiospora rasikravindrae]|uniref:Uncharacterized protein n=1 Tax=Apiospora rasikravindrae TaxID=990691 RepID=A0ABR1T0V0_9PEZI
MKEAFIVIRVDEYYGCYPLFATGLRPRYPASLSFKYKVPLAMCIRLTPDVDRTTFCFDSYANLSGYMQAAVAANGRSLVSLLGSRDDPGR